jgi:hypothetical protein
VRPAGGGLLVRLHVQTRTLWRPRELPSASGQPTTAKPVVANTKHLLQCLCVRLVCSVSVGNRSCLACLSLQTEMVIVCACVRVLAERTGHAPGYWPMRASSRWLAPSPRVTPWPAADGLVRLGRQLGRPAHLSSPRVPFHLTIASHWQRRRPPNQTIRPPDC